MKLLQIISTLDSKAGGPTQSARLFAQQAAILGHSIETCTLDVSAPAKFPGVVHALGPAKGNYCYSEKLLPWLKERRDEFDAVIVRGLWQYPGWAVHQALNKSSTPYYVFAHGMLDPWFRKKYPLKHLKKQLYWWLGQYAILRDAASVLFTSEEEQLLARKTFWPYTCSETVVSYGSGQAPAPLSELKEKFLSAFPKLRGKRIVLFLGRIHEKKGCDLLLNAFTTVAKQDSSLQLVYAGPDANALSTRLSQVAASHGLEQRVSFLGMLEGESKWGAFAAAEVFVLPSHQENFGIAVAESLACAIPVLISNKVNIWREIEADAAGIIAPDTQSGTNTLLSTWFALSDDERRSYSYAARSCFEQRFTIERAAQSLLAAVTAKSTG